MAAYQLSQFILNQHHHVQFCAAKAEGDSILKANSDTSLSYLQDWTDISHCLFWLILVSYTIALQTILDKQHSDTQHQAALY